jgi:hypothetical protein
MRTDHNHHSYSLNVTGSPGRAARSSRKARRLELLGAAVIAALAGFGWSGGFVSAAAAQTASNMNAIGTFGLRANGGPLHSVQCEASAASDPSMVRFVGSAVDPNGLWEASWDYSADLDPNGNAKLTGAATIKNKAVEPIDFDVVFEVPICPFIKVASRMGGSCTIKLTTNQNGGAISTQGGNAVFIALADSANGPKIFHGPFNMGSSGSGIAQTANLFGAPFPTATTAAVNESFGVRHLFKMTDGESVLLTSMLVVGGEVSNFVECEQASAANGSGGVASAPAVAPAAPAVASAASNAPTSSSVKLGASNSNKVTIAHDSKSKQKKSSASRPKSSTAQYQRPTAQRAMQTPSRRPSPWGRR